MKGITKTLSNKLVKVGIISVADYLNTKKYVLTDELELNEKEVTSISNAVNLFIEVTHNKNDETEEVIEISEEKNDSDINQVVEEVVENLPIEESKDDLEEDVADNEIKPENEEEKEEE